MLQFTAKEIAFIMQLNEAEFLTEIENSETETYKSFYRGKLLAEAEVRKSIFTMAKQGSTPAQKEFLNLIKSTSKQKNEPKPF
ncbi:MAG: hypothetical protein EOM23_04910 [Candidatus Moranbacteria bacterium]|nr:hypothetical protein [Candidatus Moranbacteria bacterium]